MGKLEKLSFNKNGYSLLYNKLNKRFDEMNTYSVNNQEIKYKD